jgi:hypothetical protein
VLLSELVFNNCNIEKNQRSDRSGIGICCTYEFPHSVAVLVVLKSAKVVTFVQCDGRGEKGVEKSAQRGVYIL